MVEECCGHDGTWAMKKEYFAASMKVGERAFEGMREDEPETLVTDCPLAATQFEQALGTRPLHPMEVLARAYEPGGFATPIPAPDTEETP